MITRFYLRKPSCFRNNYTSNAYKNDISLEKRSVAFIWLDPSILLDLSASFSMFADFSRFCFYSVKYRAWPLCKTYFAFSVFFHKMLPKNESIFHFQKRDGRRPGPTNTSWKRQEIYGSFIYLVVVLFFAGGIINGRKGFQLKEIKTRTTGRKEKKFFC